MLNSLMLRHLGLVLSYVWISTGIIFFSWSPLSIFIAFLLEYIVLVLVLGFLLIHANVQGTRRRNDPSPFNVLLVCIMLAFIHYLIILLILNVLNDGEIFFINPFAELAKWGFVSITFLLVIQLIGVFRSSPTVDQVKTYIFMDSIIFTGTQIAGVILVLMLGLKGLIPVVLILLVIRLILEIVLLKKMT